MILVRSVVWNTVLRTHCAIKRVVKVCFVGELRTFCCLSREAPRSEWCDLEAAPQEKKTHVRKIAGIFPEHTPKWFLTRIDQLDFSSLALFEFVERSPSFRLLSLIYLFFLHLLVFFLFLRNCLVCSFHKSRIL